MIRSTTTHSHPICPTCQSDLTDKEELPRFSAEGGTKPLMNDDALNLYEETNTLVRLLGALAQAGPLAVAQYAECVNASPEWAYDLSRAAEELAAETKRRLDLLLEAGRIWKTRAERATAGGKEG